MQQASEEKNKQQTEDSVANSYSNSENMHQDVMNMIDDDGDNESKELSSADKIVELEAKIVELDDLYLRTQAEMQNLQRRCIEDVKKARDFAFSSFAKDVIVVKDYLEMALADVSGNIDTLKTGVDLTLKQVVQIFERNAIKEVKPAPGDKLDPHLHQAMNSVESPEQEANSIVNVMQKGYTLNDRVLRPAMVVVAK